MRREALWLNLLLSAAAGVDVGIARLLGAGRGLEEVCENSAEQRELPMGYDHHLMPFLREFANVTEHHRKPRFKQSFGRSTSMAMGEQKWL